MRFPPNGFMEVILTFALFLSVVVLMFALQEPRGDRTRFMLERSDATLVSERPAVPIAEEALPGR